MYKSCDVTWVAECKGTLIGPFATLKEAAYWAAYHAEYGEGVSFRSVSKWSEAKLSASIAQKAAKG